MFEASTDEHSTSQFRKSVEEIRSIATKSKIVWNTLLVFSDQLLDYTWRLAESSAGAPSQIATSSVQELNRWRADMLLAVEAASITITRAEIVLRTYPAAGLEINHHLSWLMPWHSAIHQEKGYLLNPLESANSHPSNCFSSVPGLAPMPLREILHQYSEDGQSSHPKSLQIPPLQAPDCLSESSQEVREAYFQWYCWKYWASSMVSQLKTLTNTSKWKENISYSRSDSTVWALHSLIHAFTEIENTCKEQLVWIEMMSIIQSPYKHSTIEATSHPLHLEYLRLSDLIANPPRFTICTGGEEE